MSWSYLVAVAGQATPGLRLELNIWVSRFGSQEAKPETCLLSEGPWECDPPISASIHAGWLDRPGERTGAMVSTSLTTDCDYMTLAPFPPLLVTPTPKQGAQTSRFAQDSSSLCLLARCSYICLLPCIQNCPSLDILY